MSELSTSGLRPGLQSTDELFFTAQSPNSKRLRRKAETTDRQEKMVSTMLSTLNNIHDADVLNSILGTLWYLELPATAAQSVLALTDHPDASVRTGAATILGKLLCLPSAMNAARDALIEMTLDANKDVRVEAVASLAFSNLVDKSICAALLRRLYDTDDEVRATALVGLAYENRYPGIVIEVLIDKLSQLEVSETTLEAAARSADPCLLPFLLQVRRYKTQSWWLDRAIDACSSKTRKSSVGFSPHSFHNSLYEECSVHGIRSEAGSDECLS